MIDTLGDLESEVLSSDIPEYFPILTYLKKNIFLQINKTLSININVLWKVNFWTKKVSILDITLENWAFQIKKKKISISSNNA